jgi:endonuclease YncB( thermonuclease family)
VKAATVLVVALALSAPTALAESGKVEIVQPADRNVTPHGVTPGPSVDGPLVRVPAPPKPPEPPRWQRFFLPETIDAATFKIGDDTIRVSGVTPPPADQVCKRADGSDWPCGESALHNLRMFLHGRAVECYFPFVEGAADVVAPCRVGGIDIGSWLLTQGWARPDNLATDEYRHLAEAARCARRGIWQGETPPASCAAIN